MYYKCNKLADNLESTTCGKMTRKNKGASTKNLSHTR